MKTNIKRLMPILCTGLFIYSGCAKQQSVKVDPPVAPSATAAAAAAADAAKPAPQATAKEETASAGSALAPTAAAPAFTESTITMQNAAASLRPESRDVGEGLENIYFDFDSAELGDAARKTLTENFERLKRNGYAKLEVAGYTDERGSDDYNLALSERRARAAVQYISSLGVAPDRLSTIGYGEEKPADPGHSEDAWAKNRRDEFNIMK